MRLKAAGLLAVLTVAAGATHAQARPYGGSEARAGPAKASPAGCAGAEPPAPDASRAPQSAAGRPNGAAGGCARRGGGPEYNRAWSWSRWGNASAPRVGAVVVWPHHVGIITGRAANGQWIVKSGNDGGSVRERPRSVAGAVFRI